MSGLESLGLIAGLVGTGVSTVGSIAAGAAQEEMLEAQATAAERQANEERAASQREAIQRAREARLVLSKQQNVAAASGAGALDPTILDIMGKTAAQGQYNVSSALYEGEARGAGLEDQAAIDRMRARQAKLAGFVDAGSTMLSGISGFSDKWSKRSGLSGGLSVPTFWQARVS